MNFMRVLALSAAVVMLSGSAAGASPAASQLPNLADTFLRAWVRALRPDTQTPNPAEARLQAAVDAVLSGDVRAGEAMLLELDTDGNEPWLRYEAALSLQHLARVRHRYQGGGGGVGSDASVLNAEAKLEARAMRKRVRARLDSLGSSLLMEGFDADLALSALEDCEDGPALIRKFAVEHPVGSPLHTQFVQVTKGGCTDSLSSLLRSTPVSPERERLRALFEGRFRAAEERFAEVASALEAASRDTVGRSCGNAALALERAEAEAGPHGDVLTLGMNIVGESLVRSQITGGMTPRQAQVPPDIGFGRAAKALADAASLAGKCPWGWLLLRLEATRAHLALAKGDEAAAQEILRTLASTKPAASEHRTRSLALAAAALLARDPVEGERSIGELAARGDLGGALTAAQMAISHAVRLIYLRGDFEGGARLLRSMSTTLDRHGFEGSANEARSHLETLLSRTGQLEGAVSLQRESIAAEKRMIARANELEARLRSDGPPMTARTVSDSYRLRLAERLFSLELNLLTLAAREGNDAWVSQLEETERELRELGPTFLDRIEPVRRRVKELKLSVAKGVYNVQRRRDCAGKAEAFRQWRQEVSTAEPDVLLILDVLASRCDPQARKQAARTLRMTDASGALRTALERHRTEPNPVNLTLVQTAFERCAGRLDAAMRLQDAQALESELQRLALVAGDPLLESNQPRIEFYRAQLDLLGNRPASAAERLRRVIAAGPPATDRAAQERLNALNWLVIAEQRSGKTLEALWAREAVRIEEMEAQGLRTGVTAAFASSPEQAALERKAAWGEALSAEESRRLGQLRAGTANARRAAMRLPTPEELAASLAGLPRGWTVFVFHAGFNEAVGWRTLNGKDWEMRRIKGSSSELALKAGALSASLAHNMVEGSPSPRNLLYERLIAPFGRLPSTGTIAIVTSGALAAIPFETLAPKGGAPLGHTHSFLYTNRLWEPAPKPARMGSCAAPGLAVGVNGLELEFAQAEASAVARLLGTEPVLPPDATRESVLSRLGSARFVHIAAHGSLDPKNPFASYLELAHNDRLEAWQLFSGASQAELVVLSACNTRRVVEVGPSYAVDFADLAHLAGAGWVLASLWAVNDESTPRFMETFYQSTCAGTFLPEAVRVARNGLSRSMPPSHWAPFILSVRSLAAAIASSP